LSRLNWDNKRCRFQLSTRLGRWVEKTKASHGHGGEGWEFGTCLWSPTTNKTGHRIYKNMEAASEGDLILHFYEDVPFGKEEDLYLCGASIVNGTLSTPSCFPTLSAVLYDG
jgi:hypothetical protein